MHKIGPVMLDIEGFSLTQADKELLSSPLTGGLILFARNFQSAEQIYDLTTSIREVNPNIIIAVDQEGGRVQRFKQGFTRLPALSALGERFIEPQKQQEALEYATAFGELMALEVQAIGCDISFAPVLDLGFSSSKVIGDRAFSQESSIIIELAGAYIKGMNAAGMPATGKHFPGHGSIDADSHVDIPVDGRSFEEIKQQDLKPFQALAAQLSAIMPAHIIYSQVDQESAGFSSFWIKEVLRQQIGFEGVVFSDDLSMKGAETAGNFQQRANKALDAGCDMVLVCNDRSAAVKVLDSLHNFVFDQISSNRLAQLKMQRHPKGLKALQQTQQWQQLAEKVAAFEA